MFVEVALGPHRHCSGWSKTDTTDMSTSTSLSETASTVASTDFNYQPSVVNLLLGGLSGNNFLTF